MQSALVKRDLLLFANFELQKPGVLHIESCPALEDGDCNCFTGDWLLREGQRVRLHQIVGPASEVSLPGTGSAWAESDGLRPMRPALREPRGPQRGPPLDYVTMHRKSLTQAHRYRRRRKEPRQGELVLVRDDLAGDRFSPWRYLFLVPFGNKLRIVLADPTLMPADVQGLPETQIRFLDLPGQNRFDDLTKVLVPVFPLPDESPDPGWQ